MSKYLYIPGETDSWAEVNIRNTICVYEYYPTVWLQTLCIHI